MAIRRTGHVAIRVRDLEATRRFYRDVLGMTIASDLPGRGTFFRFDDYHHDLVAFAAPKGAGPASRDHAGIGHIAFVAEDFETVRGYFRRLKAAGIPVRCTDHGFTKSIYFPDPDGIELEIYVEVPAFDIRVEGMDFREPFDIEAPDAAEPLRRPR
jgi:catechol 2,3-dioxygenase